MKFCEAAQGLPQSDSWSSYNPSVPTYIHCGSALLFPESRSVMSNSLQPHGLYSPWNSPGHNTGVGSLFFLQGIFPTQESNPGLPHCRRILYQLSHKGSPRILKWVAYPFSSRSSWPRNWSGVSCIAGGFFTNWDIREAQSGSQDFFIISLISIGSVAMFPHFFLILAICVLSFSWLSWLEFYCFY